MDNIDDKLKELKVREKRIRNRTIMLTALVPVLTIVVSLITTSLTIKSEYKIDKLNFTQEQINSLLQEDNVVLLRKRMKFLIESDLIGTEDNKEQIINALDNNMIDEFKSLEAYMAGVYKFDDALKLDIINTNEDSAVTLYTQAIIHFTDALELNPNNLEANVDLAAVYRNVGSIKNMDSFTKRAIIEYNKALKLDSSALYIRVHRLIALMDLDRIDDSYMKEIEFIKSKDWQKMDSIVKEDFVFICTKLNIEI